MDDLQDTSLSGQTSEESIRPSLHKRARSIPHRPKTPPAWITNLSTTPISHTLNASIGSTSAASEVNTKSINPSSVPHKHAAKVKDSAFKGITGASDIVPKPTKGLIGTATSEQVSAPKHITGTVDIASEAPKHVKSTNQIASEAPKYTVSASQGHEVIVIPDTPEIEAVNDANMPIVVPIDMAKPAKGTNGSGASEATTEPLTTTGAVTAEPSTSAPVNAPVIAGTSVAPATNTPVVAGPSIAPFVTAPITAGPSTAAAANTAALGPAKVTTTDDTAVKRPFIEDLTDDLTKKAKITAPPDPGPPPEAPEILDPTNIDTFPVHHIPAALRLYAYQRISGWSHSTKARAYLAHDALLVRNRLVEGTLSRREALKKLELLAWCYTEVVKKRVRANMGIDGPRGIGGWLEGVMRVERARREEEGE